MAGVAVLDMGGSEGVFVMQAGSDVELVGLTLVNLPPGAVAYYPNSLLTSMLWGFRVMPNR